MFQAFWLARPAFLSAQDMKAAVRQMQAQWTADLLLLSEAVLLLCLFWNKGACMGFLDNLFARSNVILSEKRVGKTRQSPGFFFTGKSAHAILKRK